MIEIGDWNNTSYVCFDVSKENILNFLKEIKSELELEASQNEEITIHP